MGWELWAYLLIWCLCSAVNYPLLKAAMLRGSPATVVWTQGARCCCLMGGCVGLPLTAIFALVFVTEWIANRKKWNEPASW